MSDPIVGCTYQPDTLAPPPYRGNTLSTSPPIDIKNLSIDEKKELLDDISEADVDYAATISNFTSNKTLIVNAKGVALICFPYPYNKETEISVTTPDGKLEYILYRESISSGDAVLSAPGRGDLIISKYRFGPGRDPKLKVVDATEGSDEILVSGKWTSRAQTFTYAAVPIAFDWTYRREIVPKTTEDAVLTENKDQKAKKEKEKTLVLEVSAEDKKATSRVAMFVRNDQTRTLGSKASYAGNGGELRIDQLVAKALGLSEEVIVATLMMMLKKEVDRQRCIQWLAISAAAGG